MLRAFHKLFPDVARRELRAVHLQDEGGPGAIPSGEYFFVESYCTNPDCDCERVAIDVVERRLGAVGTISYDLDASGAPTYANRSNPCLEPSVRQGKYAEQALAIFKEVVLDEEYNERLRRHYRLVKSAAGSWSDGSEYDVASRRGEGHKQQRKQQKAARRRNRRR